MAAQTTPMNASPTHSKAKVTLALASPFFVAGTHVSGKMQLECKADHGLGIGIIGVEILGVQELTSKHHSATQTLLHTRRLFQGPGLPPSNAVSPLPQTVAHPHGGRALSPSDAPLPPHHYPARRGTSTFFFKFPLPLSSPPSISFGGGLARVRYEVRASVGVVWRGERRVVMGVTEVEVLAGLGAALRPGLGLDVAFAGERMKDERPMVVAVGEQGKIWVQGCIVGVDLGDGEGPSGVVVAGESACVELQVKNHSTKKNTGLSLSLIRELVLPGSPPAGQDPIHIADTLTSVSFKGPEYIIHPGVEGVASLVFDVPHGARGVKGGALWMASDDDEDGDDDANNGGGVLVGMKGVKKRVESLFEVKCVVVVKISMGLASKDIEINIPLTIVHPIALPPLPLHIPEMPPYHHQYPHHQPQHIYAHLPQSRSPPPPQPHHALNPYQQQQQHATSTPPLMVPYLDSTNPTHLWVPPLGYPLVPTGTGNGNGQGQMVYMLPPPGYELQRPASAGDVVGPFGAGLPFLAAAATTTTGAAASASASAPYHHYQQQQLHHHHHYGQEPPLSQQEFQYEPQLWVGSSQQEEGHQLHQKEGQQGRTLPPIPMASQHAHAHANAGGVTGLPDEDHGLGLINHPHPHHYQQAQLLQGTQLQPSHEQQSQQSHLPYTHTHTQHIHVPMQSQSQSQPPFQQTQIGQSPQGKGKETGHGRRASRISQHLRETTRKDRGRSVSPLAFSERREVAVGAGAGAGAGVGVVGGGLTVIGVVPPNGAGGGGGEAVVHSPRPVLSPKTSYYEIVDPTAAAAAAAAAANVGGGSGGGGQPLIDSARNDIPGLPPIGADGGLGVDIGGGAGRYHHPQQQQQQNQKPTPRAYSSKSERVEELERMAEEVVRAVKGDLSSGDFAVLKEKARKKKRREEGRGDGGVIVDDGAGAGVGGDAGGARDKTLPGPPVPTKKGRVKVGGGGGNDNDNDNKKSIGKGKTKKGVRIDRYFDLPSSPAAESAVVGGGEGGTEELELDMETLLMLSPPQEVGLAVPGTKAKRPKGKEKAKETVDGDDDDDDERTPPTPTLKPSTRPTNNNHNRLWAPRTPTGESGLDALERRLLAEVGTRKVDENGRKPDVRSVLKPITIPASSHHPSSSKPSAPSGLGLPETRGDGGGGADAAVGAGVDEGAGTEAGGEGGEKSAVDDEAVNDSAISSLTLADARGGGLGVVFEGHQLLQQQQQQHRQQEETVERGGTGGDDHDSDERTHRAAKSNMSASDGEGMRKRRKKKKLARESGSGSGGAGASLGLGTEGEDGRHHRAKKKSEAAKGRVAAWLGGLGDAEVPVVPPQPEADLPTVEGVEGMPVLGDQASDLDGLFSGGISASDNVGLGGGAGVVAIGSSPAKVADAVLTSDHQFASATIIQPSESQRQTDEVHTSPNPRSSGFVPIGTLKHNTFQRRPVDTTMIGTVANEARRVMDLWSGALPAAVAPENKWKGKEGSPKVSAYGLLSSANPTIQTARTNRNVTPPSAALDKTPGAKSVWDTLAEKPAVIPSIPEKPKVLRGGLAEVKEGDKRNKLRLAEDLPKGLSPFDRLSEPQHDEETRYDIRSARGGRGGKVTAVASIWAAGMFGGGDKVKEPDDGRVKGKEREKTRDVRPLVPPPLPRTSVPNIPSRAGGIASSKPTAAPDAPTSKTPVTPSTSIEVKKSRPPPPLPSTKPSLLLKPSVSSSPPLPSGDLPASKEPRLLSLATSGNKRLAPRPIIKSSSVPAIISSSHATPTLSSTASLARQVNPAGASRSRPSDDSAITSPKGGARALQTNAANSTSPFSPTRSSAKVAPRPPTTKPAAFRVPSTISENSSVSGVAKTPSTGNGNSGNPLSAETTKPVLAAKPTEMAFGKARLRDLIKKYQQGATS